MRCDRRSQLEDRSRAHAPRPANFCVYHSFRFVLRKISTSWCTGLFARFQLILDRSAKEYAKFSSGNGADSCAG